MPLSGEPEKSAGSVIVTNGWEIEEAAFHVHFSHVWSSFQSVLYGPQHSPLIMYKM